MPKDTILVRVEYLTGLEEGADDTGYPYYVARTAAEYSRHDRGVAGRRGHGSRL